MAVSRLFVDRELYSTMSVFDISLFIFRDHGGVQISLNIMFTMYGHFKLEIINFKKINVGNKNNT